jgi:DNA-directed RNA polymerase specialized sigma24 family protein
MLSVYCHARYGICGLLQQRIAAENREELARAEFQKCVQAALKAIPKEYRRALIFRYVLELSGRQLEHALAKPRQVVERWLEKGRESLREQLVAAGCTFKGAGDEANMLSAPGAALKRSLS